MYKQLLSVCKYIVSSCFCEKARETKSHLTKPLGSGFLLKWFFAGAATCLEVVHDNKAVGR